MSNPKKRKNLFIGILKLLGWTVMAAVLFTVGILMGVVNILTPERLTPITEKIATQALNDVKVEIEKVELSIMSSFPFVHARIDNLTLLSTVPDKLDAETRSKIPAYTDTVLSVKSFEGGLNVMKLFGYQLDLADVTIVHPSANLVIINDRYTNFDIFPESDKKDEKPFNWQDIPGISLKRFVIVDPGKIRFLNNKANTEISASFERVELIGEEAPLYSLHFDGNVNAPSEFYGIVNLPSLKFGLNGSMKWSQKNPEHLALEDFDFAFSIFAGRINTVIDMSEGFVMEKLDIDLLPFDVTEALEMIPTELAEEFGIPLPGEIETDAKIKINYTLDRPWNIGSDEIAPFKLSMNIPPCYFAGYDLVAENFETKLDVTLDRPWDFKNGLPYLTADIVIPPMAAKWNGVKLDRFSSNLTVNLKGGTLDDAVFHINELELHGVATRLSIDGVLTRTITDPTFDGNINGKIVLHRLPAKILNAIDGSISGTVNSHIGMNGSMSMMNIENFHKLKLRGKVELSDLYWISGDTVNMFDIHKATVTVGTSEKFERTGDTKVDSLFRVGLKVDSGIILHSDLLMNLKGFNINLAAQNSSERLTRGRVNPMGGSLSLKSFNLLKTNDSAVVRLRNVSGYTVIKAYENNFRTPEFIFDLNAGRISTGDRETRILINDAHTHFNARKVAKNKAAQRFTKIADSIHNAHPHLSPDSVIYYALQIHNRHRSKYPRVHPQYSAEDSLSVFDWGASPLFKRLLTLWTFDGYLTSNRAGLFTQHLPLRNRLRNIDIKFNNDTVSINNLQYKIGHSDFTVNGVVSNMSRAFTSTDGRQPLKINFELVSDTIDINQLTEAMMTGAAYAATDEDRRRHFDLQSLNDDELALEQTMARMTQDAPDTVMPILIPPNLDAEFTMRSNHVRYSDFELNDMTGKLLTYGGNLNLQNMYASSPVGSIDISALYSGLHPDKLRFGFGLKLNDFNIHRFLKLVPAVDSILPVMRDFSGIISAEIAATSDVDQHMNLMLNTLDAAIGIQGDSLVLLDPDTFKSVAKWLLFKDKQRNIIDHMDVQMIIKDNQIDVYPFVFDFDRYKLGVQGYNDFDMNFDYHIAVLKSPIPFKFGINVSGNPDKIKVRLGGAKFGEKQIRQVAIVDTTRINLMNEINNVFRRGARDARLARLRIDKTPLAAEIDLATDSLTHEDSLRFIQEGLIEAPVDTTNDKGKKSKRKKRNDSADKSSAITEGSVFPVLAVAVANQPTRRRRRKNIA